MSEHRDDGMEWIKICMIHEVAEHCTCDSVVKTDLYCSICYGMA